MPCVGTPVGSPPGSQAEGCVVELQTLTATWQLDAACRGPHAVHFFPPSQGERREDREVRERRAKAICATCRVQSECLEYAVAIREPHGVWGGLTETERRSLVRA